MLINNKEEGEGRHGARQASPIPGKRRDIIRHLSQSHPSHSPQRSVPRRQAEKFIETPYCIVCIFIPPCT